MRIPRKTITSTSETKQSALLKSVDIVPTNTEWPKKKKIGDLTGGKKS